MTAQPRHAYRCATTAHGRHNPYCLLAAKRPRLIPILDNKVRDLIQPPPTRFWISMWDELSDDSRRASITEICANAPADVSLLLRIDVALWMAATQHRR